MLTVPPTVAVAALTAVLVDVSRIGVPAHSDHAGGDDADVSLATSLLVPSSRGSSDDVTGMVMKSGYHTDAGDAADSGETDIAITDDGAAQRGRRRADRCAGGCAQQRRPPPRLTAPLTMVPMVNRRAEQACLTTPSATATASPVLVDVLSSDILAQADRTGGAGADGEAGRALLVPKMPSAPAPWAAPPDRPRRRCRW